VLGPAPVARSFLRSEMESRAEMRVARRSGARAGRGQCAQTVTVIVLDANAMPHGQFSSGVLEGLRTVVGRSASIVVPEVVIWEWADHARSAHVALEEAIKRHRVHAELVDRPLIVPAPSIEDLVCRIEASLPYDVSVWRPSEDAWRAAVRDQVLQVGSGEIKSNVKTGASDAIAFACVEHESNHAEGAVIVLTSDKLLRKNVTARFDNVRAASGTGALLEALNTFVPDTEDLELRLAEDLPAYLNERYRDSGEMLPFRDLGVAMEAHGEFYGSPGENGLPALIVTRVDIAEVHGFRVEADGAERVALADLRLFGSIPGDVLIYHEVVPGESGASREVVDFSSDFVDVTVAVRWDHNWRIETVVSTGVAVLVITGPEEDESDDVPRFRAEPSS